MALSKPNRLKHHRDFNGVYQRGLRRNSTHLTLRALHHSKLPKKSLEPGAFLEPLPSQMGISISRKVSKRAVIRNRIKRRIRAAFRHLLPRMTSGWKLIIIVRPQAVECDYFQLLQELEQLLTNAEVLNGN